MPGQPINPPKTFILNGEAHPLTPDLTLLALVRSLELDPARVAAAVNDDFYAAGHLPDRPLQPGDVVDVVRMMVGGQGADPRSKGQKVQESENDSLRPFDL